ncbi:disulfide oxidoreductase [Metabacillus indicus]|uniref:disulfide oxidoreductase n=1 Tax=Metabacillus indicus TaxID=246786 RepID=UPI003CF4DC57
MSEREKKYIENALFTAWGASFISMLGSLYFSEVLDFVPCNLCWYQRILMYPLVVILGIAVIKKDYQIAFYTMILSGIGGAISIYHYAVQKIDFIGENSASCGIVPCTGEYINWLGFITIPFLALIGFSIIFAASFTIHRKWKAGK